VTCNNAIQVTIYNCRMSEAEGETKTRSPAVLRGRRLGSGHGKGRPDLGILRGHEPVKDGLPI
jgi:hypothetical protein